MSEYEKIHEYVSGLTIVDTHEHLPDHAAGREKPTDVLREYLYQYMDKDLVSAGLPLKSLEAARDVSEPLMERWRIVEPYWNLAANTGYARALNIAARDLHHVDGIRADTIEELNASFQKTLDDTGWFRHVLRERCHIAASIVDGGVDYNSSPWCDELFAPVWGIDNLLMIPGFGAGIAAAEARNGLRVRSLDDYLDLIDADIALSAKLGYCGYKLGAAYQRTLRFERVGIAEAEEQFNFLAAGTNERLWQGRPKDAPAQLQDYCAHRCFRAIEKTGLPLQIHTGLQEGNGNLWSNSDPLLLNNLFSQYPELKFDLFHIGYPNWFSLSVLAKNYPNVYIDMCWAHVISPEASVNAVMEFVDSVPSNKVSAFGGDYRVIDPIYGHQVMARRNVSRALARKVESGAFDMDMARLLARRMFFDNPAKLFNIKVQEGSDENNSQ